MRRLIPPKGLPLAAIYAAYDLCRQSEPWCKRDWWDIDSELNLQVAYCRINEPIASDANGVTVPLRILGWTANKPNHVITVCDCTQQLAWHHSGTDPEVLKNSF